MNFLRCIICFALCLLVLRSSSLQTRSVLHAQQPQNGGSIRDVAVDLNDEQLNKIVEYIAHYLYRDEQPDEFGKLQSWRKKAAFLRQEFWSTNFPKSLPADSRVLLMLHILHDDSHERSDKVPLGDNAQGQLKLVK